MTQFNVGDRVKVSRNGKLLSGTICDTREDISIGVAFDIYSGARHSCAGTCTHGHGWYVSYKDIMLLEPAIVLSKQELICKKVKELQKKFEERKLIYDF